jgi:hypothetical protein
MRLILGNLQRYDAAFSEAEQALLRKAAPVHGVDFTFDEEGKFKQWHQEYVFDVDLLPVHWLKDLKVKRAIAGDAIEKSVHREQVILNQKVNVAVPGLGLLAMARVMLASDCCTDLLSEHLQRGWRILAICPQPDQRRPDYILGKPAEAIHDGN